MYLPHYSHLPSPQGSCSPMIKAVWNIIRRNEDAVSLSISWWCLMTLNIAGSTYYRCLMTTVNGCGS